MKNSGSRFLRLVIPVRFVVKRYPTAKVTEGTNKNLPATNTLAQLSPIYTDPESHDAQRHRQTDRRHDDANYTRSYCVAVGLRSAKNSQH